MAREVALFDVPEIAFTESDEMPEPQSIESSSVFGKKVLWQNGGNGLEIYETEAGIEDVVEGVTMGDKPEDLRSMLNCIKRMMEFTKSKGATLGNFVPEILLVNDEDRGKPNLKTMFETHAFTLVDKGEEKVWALILPGSSKHSDMRFFEGIIDGRKPTYRVERARELADSWMVDKCYCELSYYFDCVLVCYKSMIDIIDSNGPVYCYGISSKEFDSGKPKSFVLRLSDAVPDNIKTLTSITNTMKLVNSFSIKSTQTNELHRRIALFSPRNKLICKNHMGPFITVAMHKGGFEEEIKFLEREGIKLRENVMTKSKSIGMSRCYIFCAKNTPKLEYYAKLSKLYDELRKSKSSQFTHEPSGCFDRTYVF